MSERLLEARNRGGIAAALLDHLTPYISETKATILSSLMVKYRQGEADFTGLLSGVAALCALEDLENNFKQDIARGEKASKEINREFT